MAELQQSGDTLSRREQEVAAAYATGASYKEIARDLGISPQTVRTYLGVIYRKLGVSSKIALASTLVKEVSTDQGTDDFPARQDKPSIAILAFANMSGDPDQEYFSDGISDDIITALSHSRWLFVIARSSTFTYKGRDTDIRIVARELGVRFVLEGGVRRSGDRVRVTARLVDGETGAHVWTDRYDGKIEDVFDLQDEITRNVAASIQTAVHINAGDKPIERKYRPNLTVWELTMRAWRLLYDFKPESYDTARSLLERALAIDPKSAEATMLMSVLHHHEHDFGNPQDRDALADAAYVYAKRAVELDNRNEYAFWALGICSWPLGMHDEAIGALERAVELNPNCSLAYGSLGSALAYIGRSEEALKNQNIAIRSNPKDPSIFYRFGGIALAHYVAERYDETVEWATRSIKRKPEWVLGHFLRAAGLVALDELEAAQQAIAECRESIPDLDLSRLEFFPLADRRKMDQLRQHLEDAGL